MTDFTQSHQKWLVDKRQDVQAAIAVELASTQPGGPFLAYAIAVNDSVKGLPNLDAQQREIAILAVLIGRSKGQNLGIHFVTALSLGLTVAQLEELLVVVGAYGGVEAATDSLYVLRETTACVVEILAGSSPSAAKLVGALIEKLAP